MQALKEVIKELNDGFCEDIFPYLHKVCHSSRYKRAVKVTNDIFDWINRQIAEHKQSFTTGKLLTITIFSEGVATLLIVSLLCQREQMSNFAVSFLI